MKVSFSIPSKPKPKPCQSDTNDDKSKQYVTEFDSSKTTNPNHIIPPMENEWPPIKRMKNLELPINSIRFEVSSADSGSDNISYGLNLRRNTTGAEEVLLDKLKRVREPSLEEFEAPVEGFGAALLGGYGWYEGRGIGRNAKEDVKVKLYHKRTHMEGLGFVANDVKRRRKWPRRTMRGT